VVGILGLASLPAVFWSFVHFVPLTRDVAILTRVSHYAPGVFEVEWARFDPGSDESGPGPPVAVGTIGGRREILDLTGLLPRSPVGLNALQDMMPGGTRIDVLYDAAASLVHGRIRLVPRTPDLRAQRLQAVKHALLIGYGPALLMIGVGLLAGRLGGERMGCWFAPSVFFLLCQVLMGLMTYFLARS
jgi:hypothetical protein